MGTHPVQGGIRHTPLWDSERGPRPGEEYVHPGRRLSTPLRVRWPVKFLGLPLAGGGAVQTATASGTTVPPRRRTLALGRNTQGGFGRNSDRTGTKQDQIK